MKNFNDKKEFFRFINNYNDNLVIRHNKVYDINNNLIAIYNSHEL